MTLGERTSLDSPFSVLYAQNKPEPKKRKSKAKPIKEVMQRAATRSNKYSDFARHTNGDKTQSILKANI